MYKRIDKRNGKQDGDLKRLETVNSQYRPEVGLERLFKARDTAKPNNVILVTFYFSFATLCCNILTL